MGKRKKDTNYKTSYADVSGRIRITYDNESRFTKLLSSLKQYNMHAYKDLIFNLLPKLRLREFEGETEDNIHYRYYLESSYLFEQVHGKTYLYYRYEEPNLVVFESLTPEDFLIAGHTKMLQSYKGVPITSAKDRFKVDMIYSINNHLK